MKWTFNGTGNYYYAPGRKEEKYLPHGYKQLNGTLLDWCDIFISQQARSGKKKHGTITTYRVRSANLRKFLTAIEMPGIRPSQITIHFAEDYEMYLREKKVSNDYVMKNILFLRKVLRQVVKASELTHNPLDSYEFHYERKFKNNHITIKDLQKLMSASIAQERLQEVRDIFVFCCYTGLSYCDLEVFDYYVHCYSKNGQKWLRMKRNKTTHEALLPLLPEAEQILVKYNYKLRIISNSKLNSYIKEIADIAGINAHLTCHVARKTFGMMMLNVYKYSLEKVSRMLGHNSIKTTQGWYVKVEEEYFCKA
jgi:site-specific recombinase XerD